MTTHAYASTPEYDGELFGWFAGSSVLLAQLFALLPGLLPSLLLLLPFVLPLLLLAPLVLIPVGVWRATKWVARLARSA